MPRSRLRLRLPLIAIWLVLASAAVLLGGLALVLLDRAGDRVSSIREQAVMARAETVADNARLIVQEVKDSVMGNLATLPADATDTALREWRRDNAYIVETFWLPAGASPSTNDPGPQRWVDLLADKSGALPWQPSLQSADEATPEPVLPEAKLAADAARREAELEEAARTQKYSLAQQRAEIRSSNSAPKKEIQLKDAENFAEPEGRERQSGSSSLGRFFGASESPSAAMASPAPARAALMAKPQVAAESGWTFRVVDEQFTWVGWWRAAPDRPVRGVVLSLDNLLTQVRQVLPSDDLPGESFTLNPTNPYARVASPRSGITELGRIALDPDLPGWAIVYGAAGDDVFVSRFRAATVSVVVIFVGTLMLGSTLLVLQTRRDARDAVRKTTFVANVSHELKTPLTSIRMYAELLQENRATDPARRHRYLNTIVEETARLTRLVNNVLDFSRLERGQHAYRATAVEIADWLEPWLENQRAPLEAAGLALHLHMPMALPAVQTDRDALEQVLLNLLDNARKYAASGRRLDITASVHARTVRLTLADAGPGVPREHRTRIFEMFHRVDDSLTAEQPGSGLGLAIARRLLRDLGADLTYEPNTPTGAAFTLHLPLA